MDSSGICSPVPSYTDPFISPLLLPSHCSLLLKAAGQREHPPVHDQYMQMLQTALFIVLWHLANTAPLKGQEAQ